MIPSFAPKISISFLYFILGVLTSIDASAANRRWNCSGTTGSWNTNTCWLGGSAPSQPQNGDNTFLYNTSATNQTINYINTLFPTAVLNTLDIRATGSGTMTLIQAQDILKVTNEKIASEGKGSFIQSGGTHEGANLQIGIGFGSYGQYSLSGTGVLKSTNQTIGVNGRGEFVQDGGSNTVSTLKFAQEIDGRATYTLNAGTLNAENIIEGNGVGTFYQNGGSVTAINISGIDFIVKGGVLNVDTITKPIKLNLDGGQLNYEDDLLSLNYFKISKGSHYNISEGKTLLTEDMYVGDIGSISQNGGLVNISRELRLGGNNNGVYILNDGILNVKKISTNYGYSYLTINGGEFNVSGAGDNLSFSLQVDYLDFGRTSGSNVSFKLENNKSVDSRDENIGYDGTGSFVQTGGYHRVRRELSIASGVNGTGYYELSNTGILNAGAGDVYVGKSGSGLFKQTGGVHTNTSLFVGFNTDSQGSYILSGGELTSRYQIIGDNGNGTFTQEGGTNTTDKLDLGNQNGVGIYTLNGGDLRATDVSINNSSGLDINNGTSANILGDVVNNGNINVDHSNLNIAGTLFQNGALITDPSVVTVGNLIVGENGYITSETGDVFRLGGDFLNNSTQNTLWDTDQSSLFIDGEVEHILSLAGSDLGHNTAGYIHNFAWGSITLERGASLNILDANNIEGAALYLGLINLGGGLEQLLAINSDFNIYYDANLEGNTWLNGNFYALNGKGYLIGIGEGAAIPPAVPVPAAAWLMGSGLIGLAGISRHKK